MELFSWRFKHWMMFWLVRHQLWKRNKARSTKPKPSLMVCQQKIIAGFKSYGSRVIFLTKNYWLIGSTRMHTRCPKSSFLYWLYKSVFQYDWTWKANHLNKSCVFQSNSLISYLLCHLTGLEYSICVLPRQRCASASIFSSRIFLVFYSPNCSNSFLVFCEHHERWTPFSQKRSVTWERKHAYFDLLAYLL